MQSANTNFNHDERFQRIAKMKDRELASWMTDENEFWASIKHALNEFPEDEESNKLVLDYIQTLDGVALMFGSLDDIEKFHQATPLPFHDDAPLCHKLLEITHKGQFALAVCSFEMSLNTSSKSYTKNYEAYLKSIEKSFFEKIDQEKNNFIEDIEKRLSNINESIKSTQDFTKEELKEELEKSKQEIFNTVTVTNSAIFSAEPVQYWVEREAKHKKKANRYFWFISAAATIFTAALIFLAISVYKNGETYIVAGIPITLPAEKFSIALLIIATTASIWLVRVLVKLMMTNLALEIEALERSTMIKTYIAMESAKAEHAPEIRMLFYSTLFKPSNNSLNDDSTSPEYIRIIEAMLQKKT
ncbi:DUF6161 domain-containing protein [Pseudomonas fluorescens]|uniref:DUF6161 domain-containing protein n=1 Tax=Pseudomonas fluorescens TaxID=294 RepID=UPI00192C47BA|nr:DUF6161 domain-containing protein [Pseudomonas fluorescens]MBL4980482.1 hypothetical protein [Pseudomonas fluorescens]